MPWSQAMAEGSRRWGSNLTMTHMAQSVCTSSTAVLGWGGLLLLGFPGYNVSPSPIPKRKLWHTRDSPGSIRTACFKDVITAPDLVNSSYKSLTSNRYVTIQYLFTQRQRNVTLFQNVT